MPDDVTNSQSQGGPTPNSKQQASPSSISGPDNLQRTGSGQEASTTGTDSTTYDGLTFLSHMLAGGVAGVAEHVAMYPADTLKTRMQALSHPGQRLHGSTISRALAAIVKREGIRGLYGGVWAVAWGAGPAHALYFASYEASKQALGGNAGSGHHPFAAAGAGATAAVINDAFMVPVDVVKQRLQVARSPYKGIRDCVMRMMQEEGMSAFFKSFKTTLFMNIPFTACYFATYESAKKLLGSEDSEEGLLIQVVAGGTAGGAAAAFTNPLDVVKTRLQLEGVNSATRYSSTSFLAVAKHIMREEGSRGLWGGVRARVLFHAPAAAISWGVYESMKKLLAA